MDARASTEKGRRPRSQARAIKLEIRGRVGDSLYRSARAAGVPFIGIVSEHHSTRDEILRLFAEEQAIAVVENVNDIEGVL